MRVSAAAEATSQVITTGRKICAADTVGLGTRIAATRKMAVAATVAVACGGRERRDARGKEERSGVGRAAHSRHEITERETMPATIQVLCVSTCIRHAKNVCTASAMRPCKAAIGLGWIRGSAGGGQ